MNNLLKHVVIDANATVGSRLLLLGIRPHVLYNEGVRGEQDGLTFNCLSEQMAFEKIDVKIEGVLKPPFGFDGNPTLVEFEGLEGKLWQDWGNKGAVRLSLSAKSIKLAGNGNKRIKLGGNE